MNQDIKFTIIIPTRDRADVLKYSLASATAQDYENLEIIVSDNASVDNTYEVVSQAQANDPRIKYINTGERLSMSHNWEFALNHVTDGWVTILGDDDGILPGVLKKVNDIIHETKTQAVRSNGCMFHWPSFLGDNFGKLYIDLRKGYKQFDSKKQLKKVMEGKITYNYLPMLYTHGFVDMMLVKKAKKISNNFYLSRTPDVYSAIVFSLLTDNYVYSLEPFAVDALSKHSNGASLYNSDIKNDYSPSEKFFSENNIPFHKELPLMDNGRPPKSLEALVYEAYLQASPFIQHQKINFCVNHEQELEVILKKSFYSPSDVHENTIIWGKKFAELHNLDYDKILSKALNFIIIDKFKKYIMALIAIRFSYVIEGDSTLPIKNVFEASIIASAVKIKPRSIFFKTLLRSILKIIK